MKTITIDLETPIEFRATEGENNADSVCVKLPAEMQGYQTYIIRRRDGFGRTSDSLPLQETNNTVTMALTQDILRGTNLQLQLIAIDESRDEISKSEIFSISVSPALHADSEQSEAAGDLLSEMVSVFEHVSEVASNAENAVTNAENAVTNAGKAVGFAEKAVETANNVINEMTDEAQRILGESIEQTNRLIENMTDESTRVLNDFTEKSENALQSASDVVSAADRAVERANQAAQTIQDKLASGELVGAKGDKGDKGERGDKGEIGEQGYGIVATVDRSGNFTEAQWKLYGTLGHVENWSNTQNNRNGCRIGDIFIVFGTSKDGGVSHFLYYRSDTASGTLHGKCIAHAYSKAGEPGVSGNDGYTPIKGVDYWTEADKREIVDSVLSSLPDGDEVSY